MYLHQLFPKSLLLSSKEVGDIPQKSHGCKRNVHEGSLLSELANRHNHLLNALCDQKSEIKKLR